MFDEAWYSAPSGYFSILNSISIIEISCVERARSTIHNGVHKADLQPGSEQAPDRVAVGETVIRLDDERYWLYAAADPETSELLYTTLQFTTPNVIAHSFFAELREKHDVENVLRNASRF